MRWRSWDRSLLSQLTPFKATRLELGVLFAALVSFSLALTLKYSWGGWENITLRLGPDLTRRGIRVYLETSGALAAAWATLLGHRIPPGRISLLAKAPSPTVVVVAPPGSHLLRICDLLFSKKACEVIFTPTLRDLQAEYFEALHQGRPGKARWVLASGYWSFWSAVVAQVPVSLTRLIVQLWKISGPGG